MGRVRAGFFERRILMRSSKLAIIAGIFSVALFIGLSVSTAQVGSNNLKWERIEGVQVPGTASGGVNVVAGINSVGFSWTAAGGHAMANFSTGQVMFNVNGLVLASQIPGFSAIGTPSAAVTTVKGTVVC